MECRSCNYSLWNLRDRVCPECGTGFLHSEFTFTPGSVRFCCPHCAKDYFGTDEDGLLEPREFECVSCGQPLKMNDMVLTPVPGRETSARPLRVNPWLDRNRLGTARALLRTASSGGDNPKALIRATRPYESNGLGYLWTFIGAIVGIIAFPALLMGGLAVVIGGDWGGPTGLAAPAAVLAVILVLALCLGPILVMLVALVAHTTMQLTGDTPFGLRRTLQACTFTAGPMVLCAIPCLGLMWAPIGLLWWFFCAVAALSAAQQADETRAFFAMAMGAGAVAGLYVVWSVSQ